MFSFSLLHVFLMHNYANFILLIYPCDDVSRELIFFFYALKLLSRARRKLTNTTLDVERPSQRGDRFSYVIIFSLGLITLLY